MHQQIQFERKRIVFSQPPVTQNQKSSGFPSDQRHSKLGHRSKPVFPAEARFLPRRQLDPDRAQRAAIRAVPQHRNGKDGAGHLPLHGGPELANRRHRQLPPGARDVSGAGPSHLADSLSPDAHTRAPG
jgi:hypothetical protein